MPTMFNAWTVTRYGGPEVLAPVTRAMPALGATDMRIRIRASAVSRADGMMRAGVPRFARLFLGLRRPRAGLAGTCFSGDVEAVGPGVTQFRPGDAVFGEAGLHFGANASHITLPQSGSLVTKPSHLSHEAAAVMFDGGVTSWHFLTRVARVRRGERVLILGGSGSLGTAAIQLASALGAHVTATSSARNHALLRELGAARVVDYGTEDALAPGAGFDVVFDTLGVSHFRAARPALAPQGRYVCPVLGGRLLRDMLFSRLFGTRRAFFAAAGMAEPDVHRAHAAALLDLVAEGAFAPVMDRTYPLADLVEAHRYVATGRKRGNVVVV